MKQLLEHIKKELIARCKACIQEDGAYSGKPIKMSAIDHFTLGYACFIDLFDTEEEVLQWLEDEKMI